MRKLKYAEAINEAFHQAMQKNDKVFHIGVGINTPWYVGNTMVGLFDAFGESKVIDTPISENGVAGFAIGAAMSGSIPILTFARMDFMYYAMDQLCNHASALNATFGGNAPISLVIRAIINRKGEQGAQHSQALQGMFMHLPGIKIVMPSNAYDAKGMLLAALNETRPVLYIEDRELYQTEGDVPEDYYEVDIEKANVAVQGKDVTVISSSFMLQESLKAVDIMHSRGYTPELIDLRVIKPIDKETIINSVKKTGRLVVIDGGWHTAGVASEVVSIVSESADVRLISKPCRITLPDYHAPAAFSLEKLYYPSVDMIVERIVAMLE